MDLVSRIVEERSSLSKGEKRIADIVIEDLEFVIHANTGDIAAKAGVSSPTLTRFCRKMGCADLREFKLVLAKSLAVGQRYLRFQNDSRDAGQAVMAFMSSVHETLDEMMRVLDPEALEKAADLIAGARKIVAFGGGGGSSIVAQEAHHRLFRFGLNVSSTTDTQLQHMVAATLGAGDVLLAISATGLFAETIRSVGIARQYGAKVVAITRQESPLALACDIVLPVPVREGKDILVPTPSRYAMLALLDALAIEVANRVGHEATEKLRRIKYQLVTLRDGDDTQPLGD